MTEAGYIAQPIRSLQTMLRVVARADARLPGVIPDGSFGSDTEAAVRAFQQTYSLPVTAEVDEATWQKLVSVFTDLAPPSCRPRRSRCAGSQSSPCLPAAVTSTSISSSRCSSPSARCIQTSPPCA